MEKNNFPCMMCGIGASFWKIFRPQRADVMVESVHLMDSFVMQTIGIILQNTLLDECWPNQLFYLHQRRPHIIQREMRGLCWCLVVSSTNENGEGSE
jgi:hypothetical protein